MPAAWVKMGRVIESTARASGRWRAVEIVGGEGTTVEAFNRGTMFVSGPTLEPPLPRRKKCPELAYKTHEFITAADGGGIDAVDSNVVADKVRVRVEGRNDSR